MKKFLFRVQVDKSLNGLNSSGVCYEIFHNVPAKEIIIATNFPGSECNNIYHARMLLRCLFVNAFRIIGWTALDSRHKIASVA